MNDLPLEAQRAMFIAAGCADDDDLTASTCRFCQNEEDSPISEVDVVPGSFMSASSQGTILVIQGCGQESGARQSTLVSLERDEQGVWKERARFVSNGVERCQQAPGAQAISSLICISQTMRYGTTSRYIEHIDWRAANATTPPVKSTLVELAERQSCELNFGISHLVGGPTYQDEDDDGKEEILITITTTTGPFTGDLSTCPEEDFSGSLSPERQVSSTTTRYIYEQTPEGLMERHGLPVYLSVGEEFELLMEQ